MTYHQELVERFANHFNQYLDDSRVRWNQMLVERGDLQDVDGLKVDEEYSREIDIALWNNITEEIYVLELKSDGKKSNAREQNKTARNFLEQFYDTVITSTYCERIVPKEKLLLQKIYRSGGLFEAGNSIVENPPIFQNLIEEGHIKEIEPDDLPRFPREEEIPESWDINALNKNGVYRQWTENSYRLNENYLDLAEKGKLYGLTEEGKRHGYSR